MKSLVTIALVLAGIGLLFLFAKPMWAEIATLRVENASIATTLLELRKLQDLRNELLDAHNSIPKSNLDRLQEVLPVKPDSGQLLVSLESLMRERGVRLRKIEFESADGSSKNPNVQSQTITQKDQSPVNTIGYSFTFSGSYEVFKSILAALEKSLRLADITDIAFLSGDNNSFEFTIRAKSYYQKEKIITPDGTVEALKKITIDTSFFSDPQFLDLQESPTPSLENIEKGRSNPFLRR